MCYNGQSKHAARTGALCISAVHTHCLFSSPHGTGRAETPKEQLQTESSRFHLCKCVSCNETCLMGIESAGHLRLRLLRKLNWPNWESTTGFVSIPPPGFSCTLSFKWVFVQHQPQRALSQDEPPLHSRSRIILKNTKHSDTY